MQIQGRLSSPILTGALLIATPKHFAFIKFGKELM